jgi:hypothetical protein
MECLAKNKYQKQLLGNRQMNKNNSMKQKQDGTNEGDKKRGLCINQA